MKELALPCQLALLEEHLSTLVAWVGREGREGETRGKDDEYAHTHTRTCTQIHTPKKKLKTKKNKPATLLQPEAAQCHQGALPVDQGPGKAVPFAQHVRTLTEHTLVANCEDRLVLTQQGRKKGETSGGGGGIQNKGLQAEGTMHQKRARAPIREDARTAADSAASLGEACLAAAHSPAPASTPAADVEKTDT